MLRLFCYEPVVLTFLNVQKIITFHIQTIDITSIRDFSFISINFTIFEPCKTEKCLMLVKNFMYKIIYLVKKRDVINVGHGDT